jgi:HD-GYP domain-containing protein (c-di-GMP phosphodiesterase class II)
LQSVATFVRHHHERYDGKGYPDGLLGENIPLEARILALADAVEAMASDRPYRQGSSVDAILKEIQLMAGSQFDPRVVEAFVHLVKAQGEGIIINSARNLGLPELKSNSALREELSSWTVPHSASSVTTKGAVPSPMIPNT